MQMTPVSFWFRMVSSATAVLPVWRSPMISSRWPRPIGTMPSMALRPVCIGSRTDWRSTTPGASVSIGANGLGEDRPLAVDRLAERVDDAAEQLFADRHRDDAAGALDRVAFLDGQVVAEQHGADAVLLEVQRDAEDPVRELEHLAGHGALAAVHAGDAVAEGDDRAHFRDVDVDGEAANLVADDLGDFVGSDVHAYARQRLSGSRLAARKLSSGLSHQLLAQPVELRLDGAVVDGAAHLREHAADEIRIDDRVDRDVHAGDGAELQSRWP